MHSLEQFAAAAPIRFDAALAGMARDRPVLIAGHFDADGLSSAALLKRVLDTTGREAQVRIVGRGENAWEDPLAAELASADAAGLIVADLGARAGPVRTDVPVVVIDHHVRPSGEPPANVTMLSAYGVEPTPSTSLIAWWATGRPDDLLWLAAIGAVGDLGEKAPFPELAKAKARHTATAIKEAVALVNAPRRAAAADASPALEALLAADGPKAIVKGEAPGAAACAAARAEVAAELQAARRVAPKVVGEVALIRLHSPCQIHPLVAQSWRGRLKDKIVIAANSGYRPGWVHFAARTGGDRDLIAFFAAHRPPGAGMEYGQGHHQASGGALRPGDWATFCSGLGFEP